ncbi:MAG: hypothetical protein AAFV72_21485 [Cyanobacteria bacterium J06635_1]
MCAKKLSRHERFAYDGDLSILARAVANSSHFMFINVPSRMVNRPRRMSRQLRRSVSHRVEDTYRQLTQPVQEITNQKELRVVGLRRTGNHAIITWLEQQHTGVVRHLNNVKAGENPYRYKGENLSDHHPGEHAKMVEAYRRQAQGNLVKRDCLIHSYEDWGLDQVGSRRFEHYHDLYVGRSQQRFDVLILRDPFNLLASRLKKGYVAVKPRRRDVVDLWLQYAKEFVGETDHLAHNRVCINYNRWFCDRTYRQTLAEQLNMTFSDAGLNTVRSLGGGSSFDAQNMNGQATHMDVTHRWKHFANDPHYRQTLTNEEIWAYSEKIFGPIEGTEALRSDCLGNDGQPAWGFAAS